MLTFFNTACHNMAASHDSKRGFGRSASFVRRGKRGFPVVLRVSLWYNQLDKSGLVEEK